MQRKSKVTERVKRKTPSPERVKSKPKRPERFKDVTSVGLDIGSSAVRAAEVAVDRSGRRLRRYGQIGLPAGAVVDGEIVDVALVSDALRRLWDETGFSTRKVVLGASGHRVVVRQADVPALNDEDLRSALRFDAQELIPIPMDHASFDFRVLERSETTDEQGRATARILLVAAHRDLLRYHLDALKGAGLEASAVDAVPLALMRVVPVPENVATPEALVAIGAEMTTVAVRQGSVPLFIRSLAVGGSKLTRGIAEALHVEAAVAERLKRLGSTDANGALPNATKTISVELRDLAEEVRATIDFFVAQGDGPTVERLLLTGGASQTEGLADALAAGSTLTIERIDPFAGLRLDDLGLDEEGLLRARATAATAVGLALWPLDAPEARLSVLPEEVAAARRNRRLATVAATGVAGLAALLGVAATAQFLNVHHARDQVHATERQVTALQGRVNELTSQTAAHTKVAAQGALLSSTLQGDIDWVKVVTGVNARKPRSLAISSFSGMRSTSTSGSASSAGTPAIGMLNFNVSGTGGLPAVAAWLEGLARDPALQGTWVSGISVASNNGQVTFNSTADLTPKADSNRSAEVNQ